MRLDADLSISTLVHAAALEWVPSPVKGIDRRMLFRIGEKAQATSIVRYAPNSRFARHVHGGGKEFIVMNSIFQDETGDFPEGSYVRNSPDSAHAPGSSTGCTIFVRLWQFSAHDPERVVCRPGNDRSASLRSGASSSLVLLEGRNERVMFEKWLPDAEIGLDNSEGLELLVLSGTLAGNGHALNRWSWLRLPVGHAFRTRTGRDGARVWIRVAPLLHADACILEGA